jgi:hypothetical protein
MEIEKGEIAPQTIKQIEKWLDEGNEIAVYRNVDLSSPEIGKLVFLKVGKTATLKVAPKTLPDNPVIPIAWRYYLQSVIKSKEKLKEVV